MRFARRTTPALVEWVTPEFTAGVHACFDALGQLKGAREAVLGGDFPVMMWAGQNDLCHGRMQTFAVGNGLVFLSNAGDHVATVLSPDAGTIRGIRAFLDAA